MKIVTTESVREEYKLMCDRHPNKEAYSTVNFHGVYGSPFDLMEFKADMCNDCAQELYKILNTFFEENVKLTETELY